MWHKKPEHEHRQAFSTRFEAAPASKIVAPVANGMVVRSNVTMTCGHDEPQTKHCYVLLIIYCYQLYRYIILVLKIHSINLNYKYSNWWVFSLYLCPPSLTPNFERHPQILHVPLAGHSEPEHRTVYFSCPAVLPGFRLVPRRKVKHHYEVVRLADSKSIMMLIYYTVQYSVI